MVDNRLGSLPVLGICGYSGSGKTTLIERLIPRLTAQGLAVAVVKHDAHGLNVDKAGKDSDRFFRAGATVLAHDSEQLFLRRPALGENTLTRALDVLVQDHDLVLVEGHKQTPLPAKLWLADASGGGPPPEVGPTLASLGRGDNRLEVAWRLVTDWLQGQMRRQPVWGGLLIGGRSSRMGRPKHLIETDGQTWAERVANVLLAHVQGLCILGKGELPAALAHHRQVPDAPGHTGPIAGMLAAMRWNPAVSWLFVACDMPHITSAAVGWLLDQRRPGRWAVMPQSGPGQAEPLFAWYDFRARDILAQSDRPRAFAEHPRCGTPGVPVDLAPAWDSINSL